MPAKVPNMKKQEELEAMLESDDELPSECEEVPEIPAYKRSNRFEQVNFGWIDSNFSKYYQKKSLQQKVKLPVLYSSLNEDNLISKTANLAPGEKSCILSGVLALNDIYCLRCMESTASDSFFLWYINFLFYKDLQSNYSFLKTCLVLPSQDYFDDEQLAPTDYTDCKNYNFDIVVT